MRRVLLAALAFTLMVGGPATADHGGVHPTFGQARTYFSCVDGDAMKVQNASTPIPWSAEAPARSVQQGAGCGFADVGAVYNDSGSGGELDPVYAGDITGNLTNLTVESWILGPTPDEALFGDFPLFVWLRVDGADVFYGPEEVVATIATSESGLSHKVEFTLSGLEKYFAAEDGAGAATRRVEVSIAPWYLYAWSTWAWGSSEVPAGITFNDASPSTANYVVP